MPSTRASNFSGGGILKRKDGTVVDIEFTPNNPLFADNTAKEDAKFVPLWAVLHILEDGREELTKQPVRVGDIKDFTVVLDGRGVSGTKQFRKTEGFAIFMESLAKPRDGGDGQPEDTYPEDPNGLVADYSNIRGTRVMFDQVEDTSDWAKKNPRKAKNKDGSPKLDANGKQVTYPRQHLVVAAYYGQVDPTKLQQAARGAAPVAAKTTTGGKPQARTTAPTVTTGAALDPVQVQARAEAEILKAVTAAKGKPVTKTKLMVKLLTQLGGEPQALNDAVRLWADSDANLSQVDGIEYNADPKVQSLTLEAVTA
jgi:predicted RNA-binding protein with TRAM domain